MTPEEKEAQAKSRFILLTMIRFMSVILVFLGAAVFGGKLFPEAGSTVGLFLLVMGAAEFFIMPVLMKKSWAAQDAEEQ